MTICDVCNAIGGERAALLTSARPSWVLIEERFAKSQTDEK